MKALGELSANQNTEKLYPRKNRLFYKKRNEMVEQYLPLVRKIAGHVIQNHCHSLDYDDLVTVGVLGLIQAIDNFDSSYNVSFAGYCKIRVRGAMYDELRKLDWVPRHIRKEQKDVEQTKQQLQAQLNRSPDLVEVAEEMKIPAETLHRRQNTMATAKIISLSQGNHSDGDNDVNDFLPDPKSIEPDQASKNNESLSEFTKGLNRTEALILTLYYQEELTMQQVGILLGISESRVCQIHKQVIENLRTKLSNKQMPGVRLRVSA